MDTNIFPIDQGLMIPYAMRKMTQALSSDASNASATFARVGMIGFVEARSY